MGSVVLENVEKIYPNGFHAVHEMNLQVSDKEFLVLVGPSGCGKSTALRMIAGLEEITAGDLWISDRLVNDVEPRDRDVAMVFQDYALYPHMTVRRNIGFSLKLAKIPKPEAAFRIEEAARILELTDQLDKKPGQLSGGQRQRVAMGRAIVRQPAAFLLDEPLSNLDANLRVQLRAEIARVQRELAVTTIYVTHDQVEAMTMGDRVAVLKDGYLQQVDTPQDLYDHPANVFVAGFIGSPSMNLFEATLSEQAITVGSHRLELSDAMIRRRPALGGYSDRTVIVGIRPEDLKDAALIDTGGPGNTITSRVLLTEALGSEIIVHFEFDATHVDAGDPDGADEMGRAAAIGRFDPRSRVRIGDTVDIAVTVDNLHFFDSETGLCIRS